MESPDHEDSENSVEKNHGNPFISSEQARAKATVSKAATDRVQAYKRAQRLLPLIEQARAEIEREYHRRFYQKDVSFNAIANWLNEYSKESRVSSRAPYGGEWSGKQLAKTVFGAPDEIIKTAVLECRSRMTALALSADFTRPMEAVEKLEREYIEYIAQALELGHRLNGNRQRTREELLAEARYKAIEVAADQRRQKPVSMMARERLWKQFPSVARRVFDASVGQPNDGDISDPRTPTRA